MNILRRTPLILPLLLKGVLVAFWIWMPLSGDDSQAAADLMRLEVEVLEGSLPLEVLGLASASVHYAVVYHHLAQDQPDLSSRGTLRKDTVGPERNLYES